MDWGTVPQWITAVVAVFAVVVAAISIFVQRNLARKRAAIDFFLKIALEKELVSARHEFMEALGKISKIGADKFLLQHDDEADKVVLRFLNIYELIAVGIRNKMFDERVCYDLFSESLVHACTILTPLLKNLRTLEGQTDGGMHVDYLFLRWQVMRRKLYRSDVTKLAI